MNKCKNLGQDTQNSTSAFQPHVTTYIPLDTKSPLPPTSSLVYSDFVHFAFSKCAVKILCFPEPRFNLGQQESTTMFICVSVLQLHFLPMLPSDYFSSICDTLCQGISTSQRPWCPPNLLSLKTETPVPPNMFNDKVRPPSPMMAYHQLLNHQRTMFLSSGLEVGTRKSRSEAIIPAPANRD